MTQHYQLVLTCNGGLPYTPEGSYPMSRDEIMADIWSGEVEGRHIAWIIAIDTLRSTAEDATHDIAQALADRTFHEGEEREWVAAFCEPHGFDTYVEPENRYAPQYEFHGMH